MSKIVPKLNLNKTPQLVDNNSLVMAKNIRLLEDGTIGPDTSLEEIETNTGDATEHSIEHEAITQTVTDFFYSILDYKGVKKVLNNISPDLSTDCFNFGTNDPNDPWNDKYKFSNLPVYNTVVANELALIYCYKYTHVGIDWTSDKFAYKINNNVLTNNSGYLFVIAIRSEILTDSAIPHDGNPDFFYTMLPKASLNKNIFLNKVRYTVCNPVYQTKSTHEEVIQEAWTEHWTSYDTVEYIAQIVGLDNKIYFFKESNYIKDSIAARAAIATEYPNEVFVGTTPGSGQTVTFDVNSEGYVTHNGILFQDSSVASTLFPNINDRVKIFEYDEVNKTFEIIKCAWKYNGGKINGCVSVNGTGEYILTICEYNVEEGKLVPIKHININQCSEDDNESTYTQAPDIPITNLLYHGVYSQQIPSGVYQFFIRYEIRKDFYTGWFPCSTELFTAVKTNVDTIQGSIRHVDLHEDSNESFIFKVEHLYPEFTTNYNRFQIGFILSHDNGVFARSWKHFSIEDSNNTLIYFDYDKDSIEEINIDDLLKVNYDLYNVENVTNYKNKLYVSNFVETDFNDDNIKLDDFAQNITIDLKTKILEGETFYSINGYSVASETIDDVVYFVSYYDLQESHDLKYTYGSTSWCSIESSYTENTTQYTFQIQAGYWTHSDDPDTTEVYWTYHANTIPSSITNYVNKYCLYSLYVYDSYGNKIDLITDNSSYFLQNETPSNIIKWSNILAIRTECINIVKNNVIGIGQDNKYYIQITVGGVTKQIKVDKIYYKVGYLERLNDTGYTNKPLYNQPVPALDYSRYANYKRHLYYYETDIESLFNVRYNSSVTTEEAQTLLPFTNYDFYCHFVKQNGIVTNGHKIRSIKIKHWAKYDIPEIEGYYLKKAPNQTGALLNDSLSASATYEQDLPIGHQGPAIIRTETVYATQLPENSIVYPTFVPHRSIPSGYVGYFISMYKHKNNVSEIFGKIVNNTEYRYDCLECDTMLYKVWDKITIKNWKGELITDSAKYAPSGITNPVDKFGDTGFVYFTSNDTISDDKLWIVGNDYTAENYKALVKVTPIKRSNISHTILENQFLQGFFCLVSKLKHQTGNNRLYVNGSDIYTISVDNNGIELEIDETKKNIDYSQQFNIHSNYNLNYISLTQDLAAKLRVYHVRDVTSEEGGESVTTTQREYQMIHSVDSLLASYITTLENTFKEYTRKLFYVKENNKNVLFNNVIRASNVDVDEIYRYVYCFEATDYYNVPTHRGIITNLVAVANTLYVHCEHSLFKFTDNKTIDAQDEQVVLQENDIFNSGISEVFDAQYGYAGLKNREQSLITYNAYVFYDAVAKIIYAFGGEQQIGNISEPIKKLIKAIDPTDVQFVGDELHNRFFVNLINESGNVCLSFNFGSKSFIAVHDITFKFGFHSRRHTYFVHENMYNGDKIGWSIYRIADTIDGNFIAYQNCYEPSLIQIADCDNVLLNPVKSVNACVDIIINTEYEKIKQLDYISWICSEILEYGNDENLVAEEVLNRKYPGSKLRIYSDSTQSDLFELLKSNGDAKISNEERNVNGNDEPNPNPNSWQYPQYNCGVWSMNYFRDVLNTGDIFHYKASKNKITGGSGHSKTTNLIPKTQRENLTQESSLIYGKYFVLRFIFNNKNFKLENVMLKMNDYGKTK